MMDKGYLSMKTKDIGNRAYTLIEVLVVLTLMALLFTVGFVSYRDFSRRQIVQGAAKRVQGDLRKAQQNALSGIKPDNAACNDPQTLVGYNFLVNADGTGYNIFANCTGGTVQIGDTINLPGGIYISPIPTPNPIIFSVLGQGTNIGGSSLNIEIRQVSTANTTTVTIGSGGDVK